MRSSRFRRTDAVIVAAAWQAGAWLPCRVHAHRADERAPSEQCRVVELPPPPGGYDAGIMDIEVVDGETVYDGSYHERDADGEEHQRVVIWRGLDDFPNLSTLDSAKGPTSPSS